VHLQALGVCKAMMEELWAKCRDILADVGLVLVSKNMFRSPREDDRRRRRDASDTWFTEG
jgi:hypothetical protein